jgi:divalent metal cation (Fe/Co/Zn/Cd) transporter
MFMNFLADLALPYAYLSLIALLGLASNAIWHVRWADPIAALAILPLIIWEGWETMHGKACGCC